MYISSTTMNNLYGCLINRMTLIPKKSKDKPIVVNA